MNIEPTPLPPDDDERDEAPDLDEAFEQRLTAALKRRRAGIPLTKKQRHLLKLVDEIVRARKSV